MFREAGASKWSLEAQFQLQEREDRAMCDLLRDIIGNPFRKVKFAKKWRTDTAVALARQMYESRDFGAMPILADALQDAGCDSDDILAHCRGAGPHACACAKADCSVSESGFARRRAAAPIRFGVGHGERPPSRRSDRRSQFRARAAARDLAGWLTHGGHRGCRRWHFERDDRQDRSRRELVHHALDALTSVWGYLGSNRWRPAEGRPDGP